MSVDWWTIALQTFNFLVLVWLLHRLLYKPVQEVIRRRQEQAQAAFGEAHVAEERAAELQARLEEERAALAKERAALGSKLQEEWRAEREKLIQEAKEEMQALRASADAKLETERKEILGHLRADASEVAVSLARRLLGETRAQGSEDPFLGRIETYLAKLQPAERDSLLHQLAAQGAPLRVVTARPLSDTEQERWTKRLRGPLGPDLGLTFDVDERLLAGAELHLPHSVLRFSWSDALARAEQEMRRDEHAAR